MIFSETLKKQYSSWNELEATIEALPTAKAKGNVFEEFVYAYFLIKSQQYQVAEIYMSSSIPQKYRIKYKIGDGAHLDSGVDGLIITTSGESIAYQCKFRTGRLKPTYEELTKFWSDGRYCDYCCTVANSYSVSSLSDKHEQNLQILVSDFEALDDVFFNELFTLATSQKVLKKYHTPHDYQKKIIKDVISGFSVEDRGKIIAACGTGKTLTSLWIVEQMNCESLLFLAPSISLVKQTLESWSNQARQQFKYLCVCSDNTVSNNVVEDEADITTSKLGIPVTTDANVIAKFLTDNAGKRKYIFSTYQSTDKIVEAQAISKDFFDLIIFDEAHRTVGVRSSFSLALEDQFIRSRKRLFMTATERMVRPMLHRKANDNGEVIFSMDDENIYGPLFSRYNFGDAIKDKTISDYKIIVAGVKESDVYNYIATNTALSVSDIENETHTTNAESLYAKILLAKAMREFPIKKVISFHSSIQRAKNFTSSQGNDISISNVIKEFNNHISSDDIFISNISCEVDSGKRTEILNTFKEYDYSIISNAKCLTEGVDVPIIDSVYFVDRKKSLVDIVQACGRALRTKKGVDKTAYFIIPILIPESSVASDVLYSDEFESVYNIIQALRDQDNRLEDWIDRLNRKYVRGGIAGTPPEDPPVIVDIEGIDIQQFSEELYVQIATVNANPTSYRRITEYGRGERKAGQSRLFKTIGDFSYKTYIENLVDPTMSIFREAGKNKLHKDVLYFNHNNVSHTKKLGLISQENGGYYKLTPLGELYIRNKISAKELFKKQLLRYSCSVENNSIDRILFPYRACLNIIKELNSTVPLTFNEFAFCIYPMYDSSQESIKQAIEDILYLRSNYPNLDLINVANQEKVLSELNEHFASQLSVTDIWGSKTTTVKNQYIYFRDHLSMFEDIIEIKNKCIVLREGISTSDIDAILKTDNEIERLERKNLISKYTEAFMFIMLLGL